MVTDNEQIKSYYNPVELSVNEAGNYLSKYPIELDEALCYEFPDSYVQRAVLNKLTQYGANLTFMSGKKEPQPVKMSTNELAKRLNMKQPNITRAIKQLEKAGWLEIKTAGTGKASSYLVNFQKIVTAVITYHERITELIGKGKKPSRPSRTRPTRRRR